MVLQDQQRNHYCAVSKSPKMKLVFAAINQAADTDSNVLILGEKGTDKELIANEIHKRSKRSDANFVKFEPGSITDSLFESELFGHAKGAFAGAKKEDKPGRLELAKKGLSFLMRLVISH